jgi:hypothetical protein
MVEAKPPAGASYHLSMITGVFSPRRGSLLAAHGNAMGQPSPNRNRPERAPEPARSIPKRASSWGALSVLSVCNGPYPRRCRGLRVACPSRGVRFCASPRTFSEECATHGSRIPLRRLSRKIIEVVSEFQDEGLQVWTNNGNLQEVFEPF